MDARQVAYGLAIWLGLGWCAAFAGVPVVPPTGTLSLSPWGGPPGVINFPNQLVGTTSAPQDSTLTAHEFPGDVPGYAIRIESLDISPSGEFAKGAGCDPATVLNDGENCTFPISFTPGAAGARSAIVTITCSVVALATSSQIVCDNSPKTAINLNGTGFVVTQIPTLDQAGLTLLALSFLGFALYYMRRA